MLLEIKVCDLGSNAYLALNLLLSGRESGCIKDIVKM